MVTIKDIAREAGVSFTTVSNVIHGNTKRVSQATINKINQIMAETHYVPNMGARMLVRNQSRIIGVITNILTDTSKGGLYSPFIAEILGEIEKEIQKQGYYMMLYSTDSIEGIDQLITTWNVDGIITIGIDSESCRTLRSLSTVPAVYTDCYFGEDREFMNIGTEDEQGAYEAAQYLIECGHTRIAYICDEDYGQAKEATGVGAQRKLGFCRAMREAGIPVGEENFFYGNKQMKQQEKLFEQIYEKRNQFTALMFCFDSYAIEAMDYLHHKGVHIPEEISMIGFDDIDMARLTLPRLTTMHQGVDEKGKLAVQYLMKLIAKEEIEQKQVQLPVTLVKRESVKLLKESEH